MLLLYLKEHYFHLTITIILLYYSFHMLLLYLKEHYFHLIITIIILLYSLLYDYQFCTYLSDWQSSILQYKTIISETWCISICLCPGAAWEAWKHAPIILLPRCNALIQACPPYFSSIQSTQVVSTVKELLLNLCLVTWQPARHFSAWPIAIRKHQMPQNTKHNIKTQMLIINKGRNTYFNTVFPPLLFKGTKK